jgi:Tol biopolymer transport system component
MRGPLVAIVTAFALISVSGPALAAFPGHNGRIAFVSNRDDDNRGNLEIYSMRPDGSDVTRLTHNPLPDEHPAWSPDGSRIAFTGDCDPAKYGVCVMDADGTGGRRVSDEEFFHPTGHPAWSPDGTRIVFQGQRSTGQVDLYFVNTDGTGLVNITDTPDVSEFHPAWSPDGSKIAFSQFVPPCSTLVCNFEIFVMSVDGSGKTRLTHDADQDTDPGWAPDGTRIVYGSLDGVREVRVVSSDGTGDVGFSPPAFGYTPAWSPDGTQVVWSGFGQGNEINVMNADGSDQRDISNSPSFDTQPDWQPVNRSPRCDGVTASPAALAPPNHKLVTVVLGGASDLDGDPVTIVVTGVTQDEPVGGAPDAERSPAPGEVLLRAERDSGGEGRVYRIAFQARDVHGGTCTGATSVGVKKGSASVVDSTPPSYDSFVG